MLSANSYQYEIKCPGCGTELDFNQCATFANLDMDEYEYFSEEFDKRSLPEMKECPHCGNDCLREEGLAKYRVNCGGCDGGDWCWLCEGRWRGLGFTVCGNKDCAAYDINKGKCIYFFA